MQLGWTSCLTEYYVDCFFLPFFLWLLFCFGVVVVVVCCRCGVALSDLTFFDAGSLSSSVEFVSLRPGFDAAVRINKFRVLVNSNGAEWSGVPNPVVLVAQLSRVPLATRLPSRIVWRPEHRSLVLSLCLQLPSLAPYTTWFAPKLYVLLGVQNRWENIQYHQSTH